MTKITVNALTGEILEVPLTAEEIAAIVPLTSAQIYSNNWALVDEYENNLQITLPNTNKYAANKQARDNMREQIDNFPTNLTSITWIEEWGNFQTTAAELQQVLDEANTALRNYRTLVFGV